MRKGARARSVPQAGTRTHQPAVGFGKDGKHDESSSEHHACGRELRVRRAESIPVCVKRGEQRCRQRGEAVARARARRSRAHLSGIV